MATENSTLPVSEEHLNSSVVEDTQNNSVPADGGETNAAVADDTGVPTQSRVDFADEDAALAAENAGLDLGEASPEEEAAGGEAAGSDLAGKSKEELLAIFAKMLEERPVQSLRRDVAALYQPVLRSHGIEVSDAVAGKAAGIMKERATFTTDLWDLTSFFFEAPREYEEKQVRKYWKGQNPAILRELRDVLAGIDDFSLENTERIVHAWIEEKGYGMGQVMNTLRLALVGAGKGPGMYDVTSFIGKEECLKRIDNLLTNLKPAIE